MSMRKRCSTRQNAYIFGKFLGQRYKNNAVMWFPGGDSAPGKDEAVWVAMAKGLKDGSSGRHLVCYHGQGSTSSSNGSTRPTGWTSTRFSPVTDGRRRPIASSADYGLSPAKPTVDMEPSYENHPTGPKTPRIDSHQVRKGAYWAMLAGAAGHGYGALDLFWLYKDSDGPFPRNGFQHWRTALAYEGSRQVGQMRQLFELRPWYKLVPDQSVIASGGEGEDHIQAARADDGSFVIAYLPQGKGRRQHGQTDRQAGEARGTIPAPGSGARSGSIPTRALASSWRRPRDRDDWVLVLDDTAKGYPTERSK